MTLAVGDCCDVVATIPPGEIQLVVTSPPYNLGKRYERKRSIDEYVEQQRAIIALCAERLRPTGSVCWQVGNHVAGNEITPIDILLYPLFREAGLVLRNRIVWHFEHGLHCARRFSGRYETILWFTRPGTGYTFHLDPVRVPQKYPGKRYFKGPRAGQYSANPLGKNPGDLWVIPNVKHNHVEKTEHPCQFPVELVERLILALSDPGDLIVDPFVGVGSTAVAAIRHGRRAAGADLVPEYVALAGERVRAAAEGRLRTRPMNRPVYTPLGAVARSPWQEGAAEERRLPLAGAGGARRTR